MWLLARAFPVGTEWDARAKLERAGISTYIPVLRKWIKPRRVRKPKLAEYPLFGPHMFLISEDMGRTRAVIRSRRGCVRLVSAGKDRGALVIPYEDVNRLMREEAEGKFVFERGSVTPVTYKIGDVVLIIGGALQDRRGIVQQRLNGHLYRVGVGNLKVSAKAEHLRLATDATSDDDGIEEYEPF
jgi:hypothetical protein